jgi:glycosyltransferase involved in cell wall biosynthesis
LDVGGAELTLQKLILADPAAISRHSVVSLRDIGPVGRELQMRGVAVHALDMAPKRMNILPFIRLVRLIRRLRPSIVQTWLYHGDLIGGIASRFAGRREIIWGIRNTGFDENGSRMTYWIMRACALLSSVVPRVIVCCAQAALASHAKWGYSSAKMRVIPNGFELPELSRQRQWRESMRMELGLASADLVVGMVARFDPLKNHELFVQSATIIARSDPRVRFLLVGRGVDSANGELMRWISQSGFAERFVLTGERRDVNRCLAAMDVFCLTSTFEAFPNVIAEAMAMSLPCVVTDAGDARQIVGDTGFVVPVKDAVRLSDGLAQVIHIGAEARAECGQRARQRIEQHYSVPAARQQFERAYLDAIGSRNIDW